MSEELLIRLGSPTLKGLKAGSLFTCKIGTWEDDLNDLRELNRKLSPKGLKIVTLRRNDERMLLYLFRPALLERELSRPEAVSLLERAGYRCSSYGECLTDLRKKLDPDLEFPHEIGLFLSYPPEDVAAFIENGGKACKRVGCWKVYGDEQEALRRFEAFERCDRQCRCQWKDGCPIEQIAVSLPAA